MDCKNYYVLPNKYVPHLDTLDAGDALGAPHGVSVVVGCSPHARHLLTPPEPGQGGQPRHPRPRHQLRVAAARPRGARARVVQDVLQAPGLARQHLRSVISVELEKQARRERTS